MEIIGQHLIAAPRTAVWAAFRDTALVQSAIPGCQALSGELETGYRARFEKRIGLLPIRLKGRIRTRVSAPDRLTLMAGKQDGDPARPKVRLVLDLEETAAGTRIDFAFSAILKGPLAKLPLDGVARGIAAEFFDRFAAALERDVGQRAAP